MQFGAGYDEAAVFAQVGASRNEVELSSCATVLLLTRWTRLFFARLTTYLALELRSVDCGHRFVESRDNTIGARIILRIHLFTRLGSTVRWEVSGQPELRIREKGSFSSHKEPSNPLVDHKYDPSVL